jgi:N-methylhydantoinase A
MRRFRALFGEEPRRIRRRPSRKPVRFERPPSGSLAASRRGDLDIRYGIDTGGTFTDLVGLGPDGTTHVKLPSTPRDPSRAVLACFERAGGREDPDAWIVHGTTVATNALLERKLARTALVTTEGFADLLDIGRQSREGLYDLETTRPPAVVPRERRFEVAERTLHTGEALRAPDPADLARLAAAVGESGCESVAVLLLHAYANPDHERAIGEALGGLGVPISLSHEVLREFREWERLSTTVVNAAVAPIVGAYLARLEAGLPEGRLRIMQSNGGSLSSRAARESAVRTVLSGPAGGAVGALRLGRTAGEPDLVTLDMGGTSTDVFLARGTPTTTTEMTIGGLAVAVPVLDIHTVGAGGGSIARIDAGGALRVGPESAGADPGPVAYGVGEEITVTDAHLALGRLAPALLGGGMDLDPDRVAVHLERLARAAGLSPRETALGVLRVVEAGMERAVRVISVERGHDPRELTLVCFGGAGGLHAASLADSLGMRGVLVPPAPGTFSAWGMAQADVVKDDSRTWRRWEGVDEAFAELETGLRRDLRAEGFADDAIVLERTLDLRYEGQSYELGVPAGPEARERFHALHRTRYGYRDDARPVEPVTLRVRAVGPVERLEQAAAAEGPPDPAPAEKARRLVGFLEGDLEARIYERDELRPGMAGPGPAVIEEYTATTLVPPGHRFRVDGHGNLRLERDS